MEGGGLDRLGKLIFLEMQSYYLLKFEMHDF